MLNKENALSSHVRDSRFISNVLDAFVMSHL